MFRCSQDISYSVSNMFKNRALWSSKMFLNNDKVRENVINLNFLKRKDITCRMYSKIRLIQDDKFQTIGI